MFVSRIFSKWENKLVNRLTKAKAYPNIIKPDVEVANTNIL